MNISRTIALLTGAGLAALVAVGPTAAVSQILPGFNGTAFAGNDDNSTGLVGFGFSFNFFGTTYSQAYINNNGNITFTSALSTFTPFNLTLPTGNPIIAPFFADVDTTGASPDVTYGTGTVGIQLAFGVNWPGVGYFSQKMDKTNNFQLLLVDRSDLVAGDMDIYFNYGVMQWESGQASGGVAGLGGTCARAGFNSGAGTFYELPGSGTCGALIDGGGNALSSASNVDFSGRHIFSVRGGVVTNTDIPEPATLALFGVGLAALGLARRRRA